MRQTFGPIDDTRFETDCGGTGITITDEAHRLDCMPFITREISEDLTLQLGRHDVKERYPSLCFNVILGIRSIIKSMWSIYN